eukprot:COSAG01_NODE_59502_length_300_cov_0.512438_1_plen_40_part_10
MLLPRYSLCDTPAGVSQSVVLHVLAEILVLDQQLTHHPQL